MKCVHCNQEHPEDSQFCPVTGRKIILPKVCPACGKQIDPEWMHCGYCGQKLTLDKDELSGPQVSQQKRSPLFPWFLIGGVLILLVILVLIPFWDSSIKVSSTPSPSIDPTKISEIPKGIIFVSNRDGNPEIYRMNIDGTNQTRLTNNVVSDDVPDWSPDKRMIAFTSSRDGNNEIYVMNSDGSNPIRLSNNEADDGFADWSADGKMLAFYTIRDGNYEIYAMNADGSNPIRLTDANASEGYPDWSADGEKVLFATDRDGNWEIYSMNIDGSNLNRLTENPSSDGMPVWSPDGKQIAFTSDRDGNFEIYKMAADGSDLTRLTSNPAIEGAPSWSSDGQKIAFTSNRDGNSEIYVMDPDGSSQTRLTNNQVYDGDPSWTDFIPSDERTGAVLPTEMSIANPSTAAAVTVQAQMAQNATPGPDGLIQPGTMLTPQYGELVNNPDEIRQWVVSAKASSQYSNKDWSALQVVGKPDVKTCGDNSKAWASKNSNTLEWIELTYSNPIIPSQINIYQSFNPSQIVEVMVIAMDGKKYSAWKGIPEKVEYCPDLMTIDLTLEKDITVNKIWISVDQRKNGRGWNEIDAVELVGTRP